MRRLVLTLTAFLVLAAASPIAFAAASPLAFAAASPIAAQAGAGWVWPVAGEVITPYRNGTDPYASGQHRGIDIAAPVGAAVTAAEGGEVRFAGVAGSSGLTVSVRTGDGFDTSYLHLSSLAARAGASVSAGDRIGAVGTSGTRSAAAPHLHFGVREAGTRHAYHDPLALLPPPAAPAPSPPAPEPAPPVGRPAPQPAPPVARPAPQPAPPAALAPALRPRPAVRPSPRTGPRHAPRGVPQAPGFRRAPDLEPAPSVAPSRVPAPRTPQRPVRSARSPAAPKAGPYPVSSPLSASAPKDTARQVAPLRGEPSPAADASATGGPDIGWALACAGLLLAAAILALTDHRPSRARRRARFARVLPLLGRR